MSRDNLNMSLVCSESLTDFILIFFGLLCKIHQNKSRTVKTQKTRYCLRIAQIVCSPNRLHKFFTDTPCRDPKITPDKFLS